MKKEAYILVGLTFFALVLAVSVTAATLTSTGATPSIPYVSYTNNYTIAFTTITAIDTASTTDIVITFPSGFNVSAAATTTEFIEDNCRTVTKTISGQDITLGLSASGTISASAISFTLAGIVNHSNEGNHSVTLATKDLDGATIDNGTASVTIYGARQEKIQSDTTPPVSNITSPTGGLIITAVERYVVQGTAQDYGGSTVSKVEVSLDNGVTWVLASIKSSLANVYSWEYAWQNPAKGEYIIKVRATDTVGNTESPVSVNVTVTTPDVEVPEEAVEKPIAEMSVQELKTKVTELQQKVIVLLSQLIQLLQKAISG